MYNSVHDLIYQRKPVWSKPSSFQNKGWTDSIQGYLREAKNLTICLFRNSEKMGRPYNWFVTIYIDAYTNAKQASDLWTKAKRKLLKKGIVALWVREPTRSNKVHYHLLISSDHTHQDLTNIIEDSLPNRSITKWHKSIRPIKNQFRLLFYITKAKLAGTKRNGLTTQDLYKAKRLLFVPSLGLKKFGEIGDFWVQPKKRLLAEIAMLEAKIKSGLELPEVTEFSEFIFKLLDETIPKKQIERSYASDCFNRKTRQQIESIRLPGHGF